MGDFKIIRDPVHGYIRIPSELCRLFIDTPIFQRLRSIEQTSMRWLFPGGRHDRFVHSLCVYHLAVKLYNAISDNLANEDASLKELFSDMKLRNTFIVAALMHDCGHAPFSHTTEVFYNKTCSGESHNRTFDALVNAVPDDVRNDFDFKSKLKKPANHEVMSALVLITCYAQELCEYGVDSVLAARMITGARHEYPENVRMQAENILIGLINGTAIDVDKLDYIVRDTWASGVKNAAIDISRLLDAAIVRQGIDGRLEFAYRSTALSVVQMVIDARNYLYEWIYGHHTVVYYSKLLERLCKHLDMSLNNLTSGELTLGKILDISSFKDAISSDKCDFSPYLISDGDMMAMFKSFCWDKTEYKSYVSHIAAHIPLWKTEAEYRILIDERNHYKFSAKQCVDKLRAKFGLSAADCFDCSGMSGKLYDIEPHSVMICMPSGRIESFTKVANATKHPSISASSAIPFFYVFVGKEHQEKIKDMISYINGITW